MKKLFFLATLCAVTLYTPVFGQSKDLEHLRLVPLCPVGKYYLTYEIIDTFKKVSATRDQLLRYKISDTVKVSCLMVVENNSLVTYTINPIVKKGFVEIRSEGVKIDRFEYSNHDSWRNEGTMFVLVKE